MRRALFVLPAAVACLQGALGLWFFVRRLPARPLSVWREALALPEDERIARFLDDWERRAGWRVGVEERLRRALGAQSPEECAVFLLSRERLRLQAALDHFAVLLYPRRFWPLAALPPGWEAKARALGRPVCIVEYGPEHGLPAESPLAGHARLVARTAAFRIWRLRAGGGGR